MRAATSEWPVTVMRVAARLLSLTCYLANPATPGLPGYLKWRRHGLQADMTPQTAQLCGLQAHPPE